MSKRKNEVYSLGTNYSPFIYKNSKGLIYNFFVSAGHVDLDFEFSISEQDLEALKLSNYRFKVLYYILFREAQSTFGTGNLNPRKYTAKEFEAVKNKVLNKTEIELKLYIKEFSKHNNLAEDYFQTFTKHVFEEV